MLFLVGLCYWLRGKDTPDQETLCKINDKLCLASNTKALEFPARVQCSFWKSLEAVPKDRHDAKLAAIKTVSASPSWLHYGTHEQMVADVLRVFRLLSHAA